MGSAPLTIATRAPVGVLIPALFGSRSAVPAFVGLDISANRSLRSLERWAGAGGPGCVPEILVTSGASQSCEPPRRTRRVFACCLPVLKID